MTNQDNYSKKIDEEDNTDILRRIYRLFKKYDNYYNPYNRIVLFVNADQYNTDYIEKKFKNNIDIFDNPNKLDEKLYQIYKKDELISYFIFILDVRGTIPEKYLHNIIKNFKTDLNKIIIAVGSNFDFNKFITVNNIESIDVYNSNGLNKYYYFVVI